MTPSHIVFLPGLFARGWIWNDVAKACRKQGHTVTVLEPSIPEGFGGKLENARVVIQECLYKNGGTRDVFLVGNSMSGLIAMDFAATFPDAVNGVIISGSPGLDELSVGVSLADWKEGGAGAADTLVGRVMYDRKNLSEEDYHRAVNDIERVFLGKDTFKSIIKWLNISRKYNVRESLEKVKCPMQLIWGDHDVITPSRSWYDLASRYKNMTYSEVGYCGHSPMLEKPHEFYKLLSRYLTMVSKPLVKTA
ncbi:alpha/beta hydrolase [Candidatus Sororendozoicomonas aggregata]|uniref:alpha/beta fold hydrolase n=1 Tax=Candidatus Sororendozoicomonas aggregata TaxID=3073239 RepID=UPI002ED54BB4